MQAELVRRFEFLHVIGRGYMGKVFVVQERATKRVFALKVIHRAKMRSRNEQQHVRCERDILAELSGESGARCPFVVRLWAAFQDEDQLYLLMDYHGGGDLAGLLAACGRLSEDEARFYTAELIVAMHELHGRGILYRDLKPENILLSSEGHVVVADFGLAKKLERLPRVDPGAAGNGPDGDPLALRMLQATTRTFCGTPEYIAPEIVRGEAYGQEVDWWSLGTVLYEMVVGVTPFWSESAGAMYARITGSEALRFPAHVSPTARSLIGQLLERDASKRPGYAGVRSHPFFAGVEWGRVAKSDSQPPYSPHMESATDPSAFDTEYTSQAPKVTSSGEWRVAEDAERDMFVGYSVDLQPTEPFKGSLC